MNNPSLSFAKRLMRLLGPIGWAIFVLLLISLIGTLLAIVVGAPIGPIPLIGLIAILFAPFPTLAVYLAIVFVVYLAFYTLPLGKWRGLCGLIIGLVLVGAIAFGYPRIANEDFNTQAKQFAQRGSWQPVKLSGKSGVTLVRSENTGINADCDSFCFGLLLSKRAKYVAIMTAPPFERPEDLLISGKRYSLVGNADACIAGLPDMHSPNLPLPEEAQAQRSVLKQHFRLGALNSAFEDGLKQCIEVGYAENERPDGWVFVNWQNEFDPDSYDRPEPRLNARAAIMDRRAAKPETIELFEVYGARVATPAWIWPYGGNASTGGTFSPRLAKEHLDWGGPELTLGKWWGFVDDPDDIVSAAIDRVETAKANASANRFE